MRELDEQDNRAGYEDELAGRLALAGEEPITAFDPEDLVYAQVLGDDEDLDEDELEDEEELLHQVLELEHARFVLGELEKPASADRDERKL